MNLWRIRVLMAEDKLQLRRNQLTCCKSSQCAGNLSVFSVFKAFSRASASCHSCKLNMELDGPSLVIFCNMRQTLFLKKLSLPEVGK